MTAAITASPSTPAPSTLVAVSGVGFADAKTRLLLDGVVASTNQCSLPSGTFTVNVTVGSAAGTQTITAEQYVSGTWSVVATTTVTVTAPAAGTGTYPSTRAMGAMLSTVDTVPARPSYLGTYTDTTFGMKYTRITNANEDRHAYSRCGAGGWSKDGDRILMNFGTVSRHIISGVPPYSNLVTGSTIAMACWDPLDNNKLYGVEGNAFKSQNATTMTRTTLHTFGAYATLSLGEYEGGISDDGKYVSLIADGSRLITYRIDTDTVIADIAAPAGISDSQISPSGTYVTVGCSAGKRCYPRDLSSSILLTSTDNHADSAVDATGNDVLVCNNPSTGKVSSFRLSDGVATKLFGDTVTAFEYGHVGRARLRPGWIYLSVYDTIATAGRPGVDQIVAVKLDGSGYVNDFGFAFNRLNPHMYPGEPHACPSPDGTRVLFASSWGASSSAIYSYIVEMA